jgi:uracil-DNA glycosylase
MSENKTLKDIQLKLYERLVPSGWGGKLKAFLLSNEFYEILSELYDQSQSGKHFTPMIKDLFKAFEECPIDDLKVVMIGQDPYPQPGVADGISFSCSKTGKVQPSLRYMFKEIEETVYPDGMTWDPDLKRWSNQGVLMLNTALTCEISNIGSHIKLWKPFITYLFDILGHYNSGIVYIFLGNKAKVWSKDIPSINYKFFVTHPASASYKKQQRWDTGDMFNKVNTLLQDQYGEEIKW